jgi:hypothetical protein
MSFDKQFTSKSEDVAALFTALTNINGKIELLEIERKAVIDRLGGLISCLPRSDNPNLPVSSCYFDYLMGIGKRPNENNDNDEEVYVTSKKSKIETEHFTPPPFPSSSSSSSSSIKHVRKYTNIQKDVGPQGRKRWSLMCKIPGITDAQKQNWGRGWCTKHHIDSDILHNNPSFDNMNTKESTMKSKR